MSINLVYPITRTHEHLAMRDDKSVIAFYRIPNTPITITDAEKKDKHKITVAQMIKKLAKNKQFEISLIPKDYLLEEKMVDFSEALADDNRELGEELLLYTVDKLTEEMEIPYQFDWLIGVTLRKQMKLATIKEMATESL
ncbi:conjugal transfer protein, partial [Streptococcus pyogenes]